MFIVVINTALDGESTNMDFQVHSKINELQVLINYKVRAYTSTYYIYYITS